MGYTTDFSGSLSLSKNLTPEQFDYINLFSNTRRMKRDVNKLMELYNGKYGYPQTDLSVDELVLNHETGLFEQPSIAEKIYGIDGSFFVKNDGVMTKDDSIIDHNTPPGQIDLYERSLGRTGIVHRFDVNEQRIKDNLCQPGLWCQWIVEQTDNNQILVWDGGEKFYKYTEWLQYLITNFFNPWGVLLNGKIEWYGENDDDYGVIIVDDNKINVQKQLN